MKLRPFLLSLATLTASFVSSCDAPSESSSPLPEPNVKEEIGTCIEELSSRKDILKEDSSSLYQDVLLTSEYQTKTRKDTTYIALYPSARFSYVKVTATEGNQTSVREHWTFVREGKLFQARNTKETGKQYYQYEAVHEQEVFDGWTLVKDAFGGISAAVSGIYYHANLALEDAKKSESPVSFVQGDKEAEEWSFGLEQSEGTYLSCQVTLDGSKPLSASYSKSNGETSTTKFVWKVGSYSYPNFSAGSWDYRPF